jgi:DNA-binding NarL/FixJ family response regulator
LSASIADVLQPPLAVKKIRVLLVDDHLPFAVSARQHLAEDPRLEVLPAAHSAIDALSRLASERPDLILMDIDMPVIDGLEATSLIKARPKPPKVLAISFDNSSELGARARNAGADGFLCKAKIPADLPTLLHRLFPDE